jgi:hypothetical protein
MSAMTNRCEASGLIVERNADGRATCPLCLTDWNCVTGPGRLRPHRRWRTDATADEIAAVFARKAAQQS